MQEANQAEQLLKTIQRAAGDLAEIAFGPIFKARTPVELARRILTGHRIRADYFPQSIFRDPAWNVLLDLYVADSMGQRVTVTSACASAGVPLTTALRSLSSLEACELIKRQRHEYDLRIIYVSIQDNARDSMTALLKRML
jgi:DNA-binding MarR family transcriptional regulator